MHVGSRKVFRSLFIALSVLVFTAPFSFSDPSSDSKSQKEIAQLRQRAEKGYVRQQVELAAAYMTGRGVPQDFAEAARWYRKAALAGDSEAENQMGYFCQYGIGVPVDLQRAFHWYQLASASGSLQAKVNLGVSYLHGMSVHRNPSTAGQLFREAAEKGDGLAAAYLGTMYLSGLDGHRNLAEAEKWLTLGTHLHDPVAAFDLAYLLTSVPDHEQDLRRAAELLRFSASKGFVPAIHSLGYLLINHPELASSPQEGSAFLQEASFDGCWKSTTILGILARDHDPGLASYYLHLAVFQGGEPARRLLAQDLGAIARRLSPEEDSARNAQALAWFQQHPVPQLFVFRESDQKKNFPLVAIGDYGDKPSTGQ